MFCTYALALWYGGELQTQSWYLNHSNSAVYGSSPLGAMYAVALPCQTCCATSPGRHACAGKGHEWR